MNTNRTMDVDTHLLPHPHTSLNEIRLEEPRTIPAFWDVSEILSRPNLTNNGRSDRRNGSTSSVNPEEQPAAPDDKAGRNISELPEWDSLGFVFMPY